MAQTTTATAPNPNKIQPLISCYEWPSDEECGGGGRVAAGLVEEFDELGHDPLVHHDEDSGHYLTFPLRSHSELASTVIDEQPDVLHAAFSLPTALLLPRIAQDQNIPLIITVMGSDIYNPERFTRVRPLLDRVNEFVLGHADAVVAPSRALKQRVEDISDVECMHIPHGIDPTRFEWQPKQLHDPVRILCVSRFADGKSLDLAIESVEQLREHVDAELRIVGDGQQRAWLERQYGHHDWLEMPGWADDVRPHYDWGDIFFLPSQWEAFGLVFCEALASGLPVVTTPNGGQRDIVSEELGALASPTQDAQTAALREVIEDYDQLQSATRGYVSQHYSRRRMAQRYNNLYIWLSEY